MPAQLNTESDLKPSPVRHGLKAIVIWLGVVFIWVGVTILLTRHIGGPYLYRVGVAAGAAFTRSLAVVAPMIPALVGILVSRRTPLVAKPLFLAGIATSGIASLFLLLLYLFASGFAEGQGGSGSEEASLAVLYGAQGLVIPILLSRVLKLGLSQRGQIIYAALYLVPFLWLMLASFFG